MADDGNPWDGGDYPALARRLEPAAEAIAHAAGPGRGRFAVDIAAGTGSVALRLADAGWQVAATDLSARMLEYGRGAAKAAGHEIAWHRADLADQPFDDASQDLVASSFGLIFAVDPAAAIAEVARILTPAGQLLLTAWTDEGSMAAMTEAMLAYLPPSEGGPRPHRWGSTSYLRELLAPHFLDVEVEERTLPWSFPSAAAGRAWLERVSPAHRAAMTAAGVEGDAMMDAVEEHLAGYADASGRVSIDAEYLLARARRIP